MTSRNPLDHFHSLAGFLGAPKSPTCGVTAVAVIAQVPFDEVFAFIREYRRLEGDANWAFWQGPTTHTQRAAALDHFGVKYAKPVTFESDRHNVQGKWPRMQFKTWRYYHAKQSTTYMVNITGHVVTYRDGFIIDQGTREPLDARQSKTGSMYLWSVTEILED